MNSRGVAGRWILGWLVAALVLAVPPARAVAADATLVKIDTPRGARQAFILIKPSKPPTAAVILFAGGHGGLQLKSATTMGWGTGNFLVRTRDRFAAEGFMVAVIDSPSDKKDGMNAIFRMGPDHARDIGAVAARLKKEADVPVWLVGTSMGTFSAAGGAVHGSGADGVVLTSTITRAKPDWAIAKSHPDGVASMSLGKIKAPALILSHANDKCDVTPAKDAAKLKRALSASRTVEVKLLSGGSPPQSDACEAKSEHGFLGIEDKAVGAIAEFVRANSR